MLFTAIYRSVFTRVLAALIVFLVVSPYTEPFATITGTDCSGAGAIDVSGNSKFKSSTQDALAALPIVVVVADLFAVVHRPIAPSLMLDWRPGQRLVLRL